MKGLKLSLAAVALTLAGMQFGNHPLFAYWILVAVYWAVNALT